MRILRCVRQDEDRRGTPVGYRAVGGVGARLSRIGHRGMDLYASDWTNINVSTTISALCPCMER